LIVPKKTFGTTKKQKGLQQLTTAMTDYKVLFSQVVAQLDETHELHNHGDILCVEQGARVFEGMDRMMAEDGIPKRRRKQMLDDVESGARLIVQTPKRFDGTYGDDVQLLFRPVHYPSGAFFTASKGTKWLMKCGALEGSVLKVLMEMCEDTSNWSYAEYTQKWREGRKVEKKMKKMRKKKGDRVVWVKRRETCYKGAR
jgi:hypothetical protein